MKDHIPYFKRFTELIFNEQAEELLICCQLQYDRIQPDIAFSLKSPNLIDRRLDFSAYVLAYIVTLEQKGIAKEEIRKICLQIVTAFVQPENRREAWLKRSIPYLLRTWPGKFLVQVFKKKIAKTSHPAGFRAEIITDKEQTFGFGYGIDIHECGIYKLYSRHHKSAFTSLLCEIDEITSGLAGLELIRTGTIANGAKKCDFRFRPVNTPLQKRTH